jgi:hypothetical protein
VPPTRISAATAAIAIIVAGCSGLEPDDAAGAQTPAAVTSAAPAPMRTAVAAQPTNLPDDLEDLHAVCVGRGEEFRTRTAYEGEGPHPVVLPNDRDMAELAEESLPPDWLADDTSDVVLVACLAGTDRGSRLGTCSYQSALSEAIEGGGEPVLIDLYSLEYTFEMFVLQTRELIAEIDAEAVDGGCPASVYYDADDPREWVYAELTGRELEAALEDLVTSPAP